MVRKKDITNQEQFIGLPIILMDIDVSYRYYKDGKISMIMSYTDGNWDGTIKHYDENGCLYLEEVYDNGSSVSYENHPCGTESE